MLANNITSVSGALLPPGTQAQFTPGVTLGALNGGVLQQHDALGSARVNSPRDGRYRSNDTDLMFNRLTCGSMDPPDPSVNEDNYSARWSGMIHPEFTGDYEFFTLADDHLKADH